MNATRAGRAAKALILFPKALLVFGVGGLLAAIALRANDLPVSRAVVGCCLVMAYLAWIAAEVPVTFRQGSASLPELRTLVPYGSARMATVLSAALIGSSGPTGWPWWSAASAALFVLGVGLRLRAVRELGRFYSHHVLRQEGHAIVSTGPYSIVRHPAYAGMVLGHVGFVGFFANPLSVLCLMLLVGTIVWRILIEEQTLFEIPGYPSYSVDHSRLVPGVW